MTLVWRFAAASDVGLLRDMNEDAGYAGPHLLAVADGMGGHAAGEVASAAAIAALAGIDTSAGDVEERLRRGVAAANTTLREMVAADAELAGMGTTVTAAVAGEDGFVLAHVGDSRAYLLRDGELTRISRDHTLVQQLVDEGRIAADDVGSHPQRSMLTRALDGREGLRPDISTHAARPGDRVLICSDGLSGVVTDATIGEVLGQGEPEDAVARLVELALRGGAPDNVTCIVGEAVEDPAAATAAPVVVGSAGDTVAPAVVGRGDSPATRAQAVAADPADAPPARRGERRRAAAEEAEPAAADRPDPRHRARTLRRRRTAVVAVGTVVALVAAGTAGWTYVRSQYYVGVADGHVAIYRGVDGRLGPVRLSEVAERTPVQVDALPAFVQEDVREGIEAGSRDDAQAIVERLAERVATCPTPTPTPTPSLPRPTLSPPAAPRPTPRPTPTATAPRTPLPGPSVTPTPSPSPCLIGVLS